MKKTLAKILGLSAGLLVSADKLDADEYILENDLPITGKTVAIDSEQERINVGEPRELYIKSYDPNGTLVETWDTWQPEFDIPWDPNNYSSEPNNPFWDSPNDPNWGFDPDSASTEKVFDNGTNIGTITTLTREWGEPPFQIHFDQIAFQVWNKTNKTLISSTFVDTSLESLTTAYDTQVSAFDSENNFYLTKDVYEPQVPDIIAKYGQNGFIKEWNAQVISGHSGNVTAMFVGKPFLDTERIYTSSSDLINSYTLDGGLIDSKEVSTGNGGVVVDSFGIAVGTSSGAGQTRIRRVNLNSGSMEEQWINGHYRVQDLDGLNRIWLVKEEEGGGDKISGGEEPSLRVYSYQQECGSTGALPLASTMLCMAGVLGYNRPKWQRKEVTYV